MVYFYIRFIMIIGLRRESIMVKYGIVLLALLCCSTTVAVEDQAYWRKVAKDNVMKYLQLEPNTKIARNIVLMIGDGMGISTITAARMLKGQMNGQTGEETELNFEKFPYTALAKPYTVDMQVPDSAGTMTAIVTGVKTNSRVLGVDSLVEYSSCQNLTDHTLSNVLHWAQDAGKSTGIVSTSRITHATPAALYATSTNRNWEVDGDIPPTAGPYCTDIAKQLVHNATDIQVILGGGARAFVPITKNDPTTGKINFAAQRQDKRDLIEDWKSDKQKRNFAYKVVHNSGQLKDVDYKETDYLLGLFSTSHMSYDAQRDTSPLGEPSLADMTRKAIQILDKNDDGFFLMVEGARIDHGHHDVQASKALTDTLAFEKAVQTVLDMTSQEDTLVIVTADHSHTMTIAGYSSRGNGILDIVKENGKTTLADDMLPYTTLSYANGPYHAHPRPDLTSANTRASNFKQNTAVKMTSETHAGEDVAVYAQGPMAHLLTGVKEQNVLAYVMAHAACIGNTGISCETGRYCAGETCSATNSNQSNSQLSIHNTVYSLLCLLQIVTMYVL